MSIASPLHGDYMAITWWLNGTMLLMA